MLECQIDTETSELGIVTVRLIDLEWLRLSGNPHYESIVSSELVRDSGPSVSLYRRQPGRRNGRPRGARVVGRLPRAGRRYLLTAWPYTVRAFHDDAKARRAFEAEVEFLRSFAESLRRPSKIDDWLAEAIAAVDARERGR